MERVREKSENFKNTKFSTIPPGKAVQEMTYTVSGGMLNPTHSLTQKIRHFDIRQPEGKTYMWHQHCTGSSLKHFERA